jgi:hypothetical protein
MPGGPPTPGSAGGGGANEGGGGAMVPGKNRGGAQGGGGQEQASGGPSQAYMSVSPEMKTMLDRVEARGVLLSLATDNSKAIQALLKGLAQPVAQDALKKLVVETFLQPQQMEQVATLGLCVNMKDGMTLTGGLEFKSDSDARKRHEQLQKFAPQLAKLLGDFFDLKFDAQDDQAPQGPGMGFPPGMAPGPGGYRPGTMPPGQGGPSYPGGGGYGQGMPGRGPRMGGGMGDAEGGPGMGVPNRPGGPGMPGIPGGPQQGQPGSPSEPGVANSKLEYGLMEKTLLLTLNLVLDAKAHENLVSNFVRPALIRRRGLMDMAGSPLRVHELAAALKAYVDNNKAFPRGTVDRPVPAQRNGRPFQPNERVSWMRELLAYLPGQEDLAQRIDPKKSWKDKENLPAAMTLLPQLIDPASPQGSWWVRVPGMPVEVATTQFVGVAGIGLDAADYKLDDPAVEKKIGIFGYDRQTKLSDIKDKPSETIALIQVPTKFKRFWLAGGGSTVVGVPETRSIEPFVTAQPNGKRGALAIMADGQVRFIPETISDANFKAMCTIKGGDDVQLTPDTTVIPPPEPPAEAPAPTAPATPAPTPAAGGGTPVPNPPVPAASGGTPPKQEPPPEKPKAEEPKKGAQGGGMDNGAMLALLGKTCGQCHTGPRAKGKTQIFVSNGVVNPNAPKKEMHQQIAQGKMPPRKGPQPNLDDLAKLRDWLNQGG